MDEPVNEWTNMSDRIRGMRDVALTDIGESLGVPKEEVKAK